MHNYNTGVALYHSNSLYNTATTVKSTKKKKHGKMGIVKLDCQVVVDATSIAMLCCIASLPFGGCNTIQQATGT